MCQAGKVEQEAHRHVIVIDDVWNSKLLAMVLKVIPHSTRLIVTARSRNLLKALPQDTEFLSLYKFSEPEAKLLIAKHVEVTLPFDAEEELYVQQVLEYTHRHPLALKGRHLDDR